MNVPYMSMFFMTSNSITTNERSMSLEDFVPHVNFYAWFLHHCVDIPEFPHCILFMNEAVFNCHPLFHNAFHILLKYVNITVIYAEEKTHLYGKVQQHKTVGYGRKKIHISGKYYNKRKTWKGIMIRNVLTRRREYGTYLATARRHRRRIKMQKRDE